MLLECIDFSFSAQNQFQVANPIEEVGNITEEEFSPQKCPEDLIGTPLECPFNLDVLKIKDDDFYSKEMYESHHLSELKTCKYRPFSSFEARWIKSIPSNIPKLTFNNFFFQTNFDQSNGRSDNTSNFLSVWCRRWRKNLYSRNRKGKEQGTNSLQDNSQRSFQI